MNSPFRPTTQEFGIPNRTINKRHLFDLKRRSEEKERQRQPIRSPRNAEDQIVSVASDRHIGGHNICGEAHCVPRPFSIDHHILAGASPEEIGIVTLPTPHLVVARPAIDAVVSAGPSDCVVATRPGEVEASIEQLVVGEGGAVIELKGFDRMGPKKIGEVKIRERERVGRTHGQEERPGGAGRRKACQINVRPNRIGGNSCPKDHTIVFHRGDDVALVVKRLPYDKIVDRVLAITEREDVGILTKIPVQRVVAGPTSQCISTLAADQPIMTQATDQGIVAALTKKLQRVRRGSGQEGIVPFCPLRLFEVRGSQIIGDSREPLEEDRVDSRAAIHCGVVRIKDDDIVAVTTK